MKYRIAVFPGDGIGPELINEEIKVIKKAAELDKFETGFIKYPYGAEHYAETKELLEGKTRTQDLNGNNTASEMGDAIVDKFIEIHD